MGFKQPTSLEHIPAGTLVQLSVVGIKNDAKGRQSQPVNVTLEMLPFLSKYSKLTVTDQLDLDKVQEFAVSQDFDAASKYMTDFAAKAKQQKAATLADMIVDAVANYLVADHGFVESETDPGSVWYFQRSDITPTWVNGGGSKSKTMYCMVALTAPFGKN